MAEVGAPGTVIIGDGDGGGGGGGSSGTIFMKRQSGVVGVGPVSFGGEIQSFGDTHTGQSLNSTNVMFDGIKGAYNANIDQDFTNSITSDLPGGSTITPYVLYGNNPGVEPSPLVNNISLHEFLDENFSVNIDDAQSNLSHRRKASNNIGGFTGNGYGNFTDPPTLSNAGPSSLSEIMNSVPHDPLSINGNQAEPLENLDLLEVDLGVETSPTGTGGSNLNANLTTGTSAIVVTEVTGTKGAGPSENVMSGTGGGAGCCFIVLEVEEKNKLNKDVRKYRDEQLNDLNRAGYYKLAQVAVPLMRKSRLVKWFFKYSFVKPAKSWAKWYYHKKGMGWAFEPLRRFWLGMFTYLGKDHKLRVDNG